MQNMDQLYSTHQFTLLTVNLADCMLLQCSLICMQHYHLETFYILLTRRDYSWAYLQ